MPQLLLSLIACNPGWQSLESMQIFSFVSHPMILCSQCIVSVWYSSRYSGTDYLRHSHISDFFACDNNAILKLLCRWCAMVGSYMGYKIRDLVMKYLTNCIPWNFFLQFFQLLYHQFGNATVFKKSPTIALCWNVKTIRLYGSRTVKFNSFMT